MRKADLDLILRNLIDNALKYGGDPPRVEIWLRADIKGSIKLSVSDNGCGIPQDKRRKIFQRFVRLGSELTREKPGTGLGLYIVRTLVQRIGGKISVHDCEAGTGTLFQVELPGKLRAQPTSQSLPPDSQAGPKEQGSDYQCSDNQMRSGKE